MQIVAPGAGPAQAAAIAAALEQFLHDTTPAVPAAGTPHNPWGRAAILEGVGLAAQTPWGDAQAWQ